MKIKPFWALAVMVLIGLGGAAMPMQAAESEQPLAFSSVDKNKDGYISTDEFVGFGEAAMDQLENGIEELKAESRNVSPHIQPALDKQIDVLQDQQQEASQTLDEFKLASGEAQPYLQARFINIWNEIVTSYEAAELLLILDTMGTGRVPA